MAIASSKALNVRVTCVGSLVMLAYVAVIGCAGPEPVLRSNTRLLLYGREAARQEVQACQQEAERAGIRDRTNRSGNAAAGGVLGVIGGAAVGASTGLVGGPTGVALGAGAGAAIGGVLGAIGGAYKPLDPDPRFTEAVERCLREKGYEVSGWQ